MEHIIDSDVQPINRQISRIPIARSPHSGQQDSNEPPAVPTVKAAIFLRRNVDAFLTKRRIDPSKQPTAYWLVKVDTSF
jgi:hypothetical protein